ncbi:hypothetical protein [Advenella incenata]|uniref:hypothetical protein n=1 Tax=Advenella incenata TaxID=267800 RepID=UPI001029ECEF|nr:hypothetical protein [Advenella incenata]
MIHVKEKSFGSMYMEMSRVAGAIAGMTAHSVQKHPVTPEKYRNSKSLKDVAFSHQSGFFTTFWMIV